MRHLWQRIFAYSLVLIIVSQAAALLLHRHALDSEEARGFIINATSAIAETLDGQSVETAQGILAFFNRRSDRTWLVAEPSADAVAADAVAAPLPDAAVSARSDSGAGQGGAGRILAGKPGIVTIPPPEAHIQSSWDVELAVAPMRIWSLRNEQARFLAAVPVTVGGMPATLYMFSSPRMPGMWNLFFQGLLVLSGIGVVLALWMAWSVSRPLRRLRREVLEIGEGNLEHRVTVNGRDEIADVATAVNHMAGALARSVRSMRELVANVSHELRSPLARMQVTLSLLEEHLPPDSPQAARAADKTRLLREELDHMDSLIGATLLTSRLDLDTPPPLAEQVALSDLCAEMCRRHEPLLRQRGLDFSAQQEPDIQIRGDEGLLCTLVSNLLDNATKYTRPEGQARLRLHRENNRAVLCVENDTVAPLSGDVLERIFEPFNRGGIATGNGVGLGLSLVKKIAALHHGTAWAENTPDGVRFCADFPLA